MSALETREVDFFDIALSEPAHVTAQYQTDDIVALVMPIGASTLTTVLTLPPENYCFGIDWWLGQSYADWSLVSALDQGLIQAVVAALRRRRLSLKKIPLTLINLRGLLDEERGSSLTTWNPRHFQAITVPTAAVDDLLRALHAGFQPMEDYLIKGPCAGRRLDTARHGEVLLERAFSVGFDGPSFFLGRSYRDPAFSNLIRGTLPVPSQREQHRLLEEAIQELERASNTGQQELVRDVLFRQNLYLLDAREFAPGLSADVALVNCQRTALLRCLVCPHFYFHLCVGLLDVSKNEPQKRYRRLKSDQGWLDWLCKESTASFSNCSSETSNVEGYLANIRASYPCYGEDPMHVLRN